MILYINNLFDNHVSWKTHFKNSLSFPYIPKGSNFLEAYLMSDFLFYLFYYYYFLPVMWMLWGMTSDETSTYDLSLDVRRVRWLASYFLLQFQGFLSSYYLRIFGFNSLITIFIGENLWLFILFVFVQGDMVYSFIPPPRWKEIYTPPYMGETLLFIRVAIHKAHYS